MNKTKLMILASCHSIGGFETKLDRLIKNIDRRNFDLSILLIYPFYKAKKVPRKVREKHKEFLSWEGIQLFNINMNWRYDFSIIFQAAKVIRSCKVQVLYYFSLGSGTFIAPIAAKLAGVRFIVREVQNVLNGLYPKILRGLDRILLSFVDVIIVPSEYLKKLLQRELLAKEERIHIIPNAIDLTRFGKTGKVGRIRSELHLKGKGRIVGMIANLVPVKAHSVLFHAIPLVLKKHAMTTFLLIGDGPLKEKLVKLSKELNISNAVKFLGYRSDVDQLIRLFDIGILNSEVEIHPNCLIEIMASGIPVVAPAVGGIPEIVVDGQNGLLVEPGNLKQMADAIIYLFDHPDIAKQYGEDGRRVVFDKFSQEKMVRSTEAVFDSLSAR